MESLVQQFMDRYLSREEIAYRLPVSIPISQFWPAMEEARKKAAILLPLKAQNGQPFWFVINKTIEAQCDVVAEIARRSFVFDELSEQIMEEATIDEAVWSSVIEGAFTSKADAARIIRQDKMPANKSEQMIKNNYQALLYVAVGTCINLLLTCFGAYVLSRKGFRARHTIMFLISFTRFFGGGMISTFLVVKGIGLYDNFWAMVLPNAVNTWNLIIMRNGMSEIPDSMEESARIDGANDFQILFRIILPLSQATLAVMVLFYAVGHWNSWFNAMLYLRARPKYPLQLVLREILISNSVSSMTSGLPADTSAPIGESIKYATMMVATIPVLLIYPMLQKYFVKGVMVGAIKG